MPDCFGHNGERSAHAPGVLGTAGQTCFLRRVATGLLLAAYCDPCVGTLHEVVHLPDRLLPAANDPRFGPNV